MGAAASVSLNGHTYDLTTHRYLGRCSCGRGIQATGYQWMGRFAPPLLQHEGAPVLDTSIGVYAPCPDCGQKVVLSAVEGRYKPEIACSAKCRNATGPSCDCSCGGANHGCNH